MHPDSDSPPKSPPPRTRKGSLTIPKDLVHPLFQDSALLHRQLVPRRLYFGASQLGCMEMYRRAGWEVLRLEGVKILAEPVNLTLKHSKAS